MVTPHVVWPTTRRDFLRKAGLGFGGLAAAAMLAEEGFDGGNPARAEMPDVDPLRPLRPRPTHHAAKAKSCIFLFMEGGPSHIDLFDPKPELTKRHGQRVAGIQTHFGNPGPLLKSPFSFKQYGQSGLWFCDRYTGLAQHADDIALIKSCWAESPNHAPAMFQMNTGISRPGFPSAGSWVTYGLGTENQNLPGFVVLAGSVLKGGPNNWGSGFLPASFQGTLLRTQGSPVLDLNRPEGVSREQERKMLDLAEELNAQHARQHPAEADLQARIDSFELAYRMQMEAPEGTDLSQEDEPTRELYGLSRSPGTRTFGEKCLLARRLVERGVRFVQVYSNDEWDAHGDIAGNHASRCEETDVPIAGLISDLKRRGLFDSTLVVYCGEFGRMPVSEQGKGRDHNPHGFCAWLAGAGIRGGTSYGETDEIGLKAAVNPVSVQDLHATILHQLGIDHARLTFTHNGRQYRLTDVSGEVVKAVLA
jgi:hypothetical protein